VQHVDISTEEAKDVLPQDGVPAVFLEEAVKMEGAARFELTMNGPAEPS
jgi:hypothetical protein